LPSHLFEYFAWDERVLGQFARHHVTNEPLPQGTISSLRSAQNALATYVVVGSFIDRKAHLTMQPPLPISPHACRYDTLSQLTFAAYDLQLSDLKQDDLDQGVDPAQLLLDVQRELGDVVHPPNSAWCTRFAHLVGYGGGYYSYLFAKVHAAAIWHALLKRDPLSPSAGAILREELLGVGGARDPTLILSNLLEHAADGDDGGGTTSLGTCDVDVKSFVNELGFVELTK
tara:strand:- start:41 stop:727 length:687 start_codon:yes stop_codon:yes gene_type:complete